MSALAALPLAAANPGAGPLRERLVQAALTLFAAQGYQAVSMRDLARHLGVQPGSLYYHVQGKEELLVEGLEDTLTELLHQTRQALRPHAGPRARLGVFFTTYFAFKASHEAPLRLLAREAPLLSATVGSGIQALREAYREELSQVLRQLPGVVGQPCDGLARLLLGTLSGQLHWPVPDQELQAFLLGVLRSESPASRSCPT